MPKTVLILGASGRFGRNCADAFAASGWKVRRFDRARDNLMQKAQGTDVIVAGWNPAYPDWADQVPKLHDQIIQAALAADATVILPGNVYVFGADTPAPWGADTPHQAHNPLGMIRRRMEAAYRKAGVKTILLRAGDYLDTTPSGNWFDMMMAKTLPKGALTYPGNPDLDHAWAFLPDLARAAVALSEQRDQLRRYEDIPFPGYTLSGRQITTLLTEMLQRPVKIRKMAWLPLHFLRPFMRVIPPLFEMRYLWNTPHSLTGTRFNELLPDFRPTPPKQALAAAVAHLHLA